MANRPGGEALSRKGARIKHFVRISRPNHSLTIGRHDHTIEARLCSRNNLYARAVYAHGLKAANTNAAVIIVPGGAIHPHRQTKQSEPMRRISSRAPTRYRPR